MIIKMKKKTGINEIKPLGKFSFSGSLGGNLEFLENALGANFETPQFERRNQFTIPKSYQVPEKVDQKEGIFINNENESMLISTIQESNLQSETEKFGEIQFAQKENEDFAKINENAHNQFMKNHLPNFSKKQNKNFNYNFQKQKVEKEKKLKEEKKEKVNMKPANLGFEVWTTNALKKDKRSPQISEIIQRYNSKKKMETYQTSKREDEKVDVKIGSRPQTERSRSRKKKLNMRMEVAKPEALHTPLQVKPKKRETAPPTFDRRFSSQENNYQFEPHTNSKFSSEYSDILLFESQNESAFQMSSKVQRKGNLKLLGFEDSNFTKPNPFLKKNWQKRGTKKQSTIKLKKTQSHANFGSSKLDSDLVVDLESLKHSPQMKKFHSTRNTLKLNEQPLEGICTDQSVLVQEEGLERPEGEALHTDSDLGNTNVKIYTDADTVDQKVGE